MGIKDIPMLPGVVHGPQVTGENFTATHIYQLTCMLRTGCYGDLNMF